jgi:hypothetical protein
LRDLLFNPADEGGISLINVGWVSTDEKGVISKKTELFTSTSVRTLNNKNVF